MDAIKLFFKGLSSGFQEPGHFLARLINTLLLLIVFIFGVGPVALIARLRGKRYLGTTSFQQTVTTYWQDYSLDNKSKEDYTKLF